MGRTLTIIARGPDSCYPDSQISIEDQESDGAIKAVCSMFKSLPMPYERAVSVNQIRGILEKDPLKAGDRLQIIGHGMPGRLELGCRWDKIEYKDNEIFLIDSDPFTYRLLIGCVPQGCEVWLVGCTVAAEVTSLSTRIADGPTLLFDLARLWGCKVAGATDFVKAPEDFTNGFYSKQHRLATDLDIQPSNVSDPARYPSQAIETITFTALLDLPLVRHFRFRQLKPPPPPPPPAPPLPRPALPYGDLQRIGQLRVDEVDASKLLAAAELSVRVKLGGGPGEHDGEIIGNLWLLHVSTPTGSRYFQFTKDQRDRILKAVTGIIDGLLS